MTKPKKKKAQKGSIDRSININKLDRTVYNYCRKIVKRKIQQIRWIHTKQKGGVKVAEFIWDYPAMASVCCLHNNKSLVSDYSKAPIEGNFEEPLRSELTAKLGNIGEKANEYIVGRCAEQQSANSLLKKISKQRQSNKPNKTLSISLDDIYFSVAMRPRTRQEFTPCSNCSTIFKNVR